MLLWARCVFAFALLFVAPFWVQGLFRHFCPRIFAGCAAIRLLIRYLCFRKNCEVMLKAYCLSWSLNKGWIHLLEWCCMNTAASVDGVRSPYFLVFRLICPAVRLWSCLSKDQNLPRLSAAMVVSLYKYFAFFLLSFFRNSIIHSAGFCLRFRICLCLLFWTLVLSPSFKLYRQCRIFTGIG